MIIHCIWFKNKEWSGDLIYFQKNIVCHSVPLPLFFAFIWSLFKLLYIFQLSNNKFSLEIHYYTCSKFFYTIIFYNYEGGKGQQEFLIYSLFWRWKKQKFDLRYFLSSFFLSLYSNNLWTFISLIFFWLAQNFDDLYWFCIYIGSALLVSKLIIHKGSFCILLLGLYIG